jgi:16S rRNA (adenine1518-N6/adenine1519-N6)-dimethyltransferase
MTTLSEMRQVLGSRGIQLTKSLGQCFLHDANQLDRIAAAAALLPADRVLEIGPGLGPLTELLLARAGRVLAVELDARLVEVLREKFAGTSSLELIHADALGWLRSEARDWTGWKVVSNLPYAVASPLLVELALGPQPPDLMVVTLQREVVDRLLAGPGCRDYGVITLLVRLRFEPGLWFKLPRTCFFPEPDVDSACLTLRRRGETLLPTAEVKTFVRVVKRGFSQRRKMMFKLLKAEWTVPVLEAGFGSVGLDRGIRAEAVSLDQFVALTRALHATRPAP